MKFVYWILSTIYRKKFFVIIAGSTLENGKVKLEWFGQPHMVEKLKDRMK